jgi:hypothetical protein
VHSIVVLGPVLPSLEAEAEPSIHGVGGEDAPEDGLLEPVHATRQPVDMEWYLSLAGPVPPQDHIQVACPQARWEM